MNHVSDNTPGTTWKYPEVPQSTQKYLKVSRSTSKYPEVPEHHLVWSSQFRAVCNSLKQFWTQRVICRDGMGLVIPEQPAYKSHRRAVLIIETPDWGELKTLYCKNVLLPKMCFCMWKLTVSDLSPRFPWGGAGRASLVCRRTQNLKTVGQYIISKSFEEVGRTTSY